MCASRPEASASRRKSIDSPSLKSMAADARPAPAERCPAGASARDAGGEPTPRPSPLRDPEPSHPAVRRHRSRRQPWRRPAAARDPAAPPRRPRCRTLSSPRGRRAPDRRLPGARPPCGPEEQPIVEALHPGLAGSLAQGQGKQAKAGHASHRRNVAQPARQRLVAHRFRRVRATPEMHVLEQQIGGKEQILRRPARAVYGAIVGDTQHQSAPTGPRRAPADFVQNVDLAANWRHAQRAPRI